jgi:hypothetical protein
VGGLKPSVAPIRRRGLVKAFADVAGVSAAGRSLYVVQIGTVHVAKDPTLTLGEEWWYSMVLDRRFNHLSTFTGQ